MSPRAHASRRRSGRYARAGIVAAVLFATSCAAPVSSFRAPVPMLGGQRDEIGFGLTGGGQVAPSVRGTPVGTFDVWYQHEFGRFVLGGRIFAGTTPHPPGFDGTDNLVRPTAGTGVMLRLIAVDHPRLRLAFDLNGGLAFAQLGVPLAVRAHERLWLYTNPSAGIFGSVEEGALLDVGLPVGVAVRATHYLNVIFELTTHLHGPNTVFLDGGVACAFRL